MSGLGGNIIFHVNIALLIFCAVIATVIALGFRRIAAKNEASRGFLIMVGIAIVSSIILAVGYILLVARNESAFGFCATLANAGFYAIVFLYARYLVSSVKLTKSKPANPALLYIVLASTAVSVASWGASMIIKSLALPDGIAAYGKPIFYGEQVGELVLLIVSFMIMMPRVEDFGKRETRVLLFFPVLLFLASLAEPLVGDSNLRFPAMVVGLLVVYVGYHVELEQNLQREEMLNLQDRLLLAAGRMKPHYIYNVMTNIYYLCDMDPSKAQEAIGNVSDYMRNTLTTIENPDPIGFKEELNQIKSYLALEKMRFGDQLLVHYDVDVDDFKIPPLTIEPLVENAVKHGIRDLDRQGTVTILTRRLPNDGVRIQVIDDGVGFDTETITMETHRELIGIKARMWKDVQGVMTIESAKGKGTTVTIELPPTAHTTN